MFYLKASADKTQVWLLLNVKQQRKNIQAFSKYFREIMYVNEVKYDIRREYSTFDRGGIAKFRNEELKLFRIVVIFPFC